MFSGLYRECLQPQVIKSSRPTSSIKMGFLTNNGDDDSSEWMSCDSADDGENDCTAADNPQAKPAAMPDVNSTHNCRPTVRSLSPDRQVLRPAEPHLSFQGPDLSAPQLSTLHSDQSFASRLRKLSRSFKRRISDSWRWPSLCQSTLLAVYLQVAQRNVFFRRRCPPAACIRIAPAIPHAC